MMEFFVKSHEFLTIAALMQLGLFALVVIFIESQRKAAILYLAGILFTLCLTKFHQYGFISGFYQANPSNVFIFIVFQWLLAPLFYLYIRVRNGDELVFSLRLLSHFLPFLGALLFCYSSFSVYINGDLSYEIGIKRDFLTSDYIKYWWPILRGGQQILYLTAILFLLKKHGEYQKNWLSNEMPLDTRLLSLTNIFWIIIICLDLIQTSMFIFLESKLASLFVLQVLNMADYLIINLLIVSAFSLNFVSGNKNEFMEKKSALEVNLSEEERVSILNILNDHLSQTKCFLSPDLTLKDISTQTKIGLRDVSVSINSIYKNSFYYYINDFRIQEAKRLLKISPGIKIIEIAYEVGFNSKSSFNKMFKYFTNTTPSEYKKSQVLSSCKTT